MAEAKLKDIPTELFNQIVREHVERGWRVTFEYDGFDAWIDYGRLELERDGVALCFVWTNWFEGEISGPAELVAQIAAAQGLSPR